MIPLLLSAHRRFLNQIRLSLPLPLPGALSLLLLLVQILHIPLSVLMQIPPREWRPDFPKADINITGHCDGVIFMEAQKEVM